MDSLLWGETNLVVVGPEPVVDTLRLTDAVRATAVGCGGAQLCDRWAIHMRLPSPARALGAGKRRTCRGDVIPHYNLPQD
jgi:hypothetical protein